MGLTEEQRRRVETNRLAALERRRQQALARAALHADAIAQQHESSKPLRVTGAWHQFLDSRVNSNRDFRSISIGPRVENSGGYFSQSMLHQHQHAGTGMGMDFGSGSVPCTQYPIIDRMYSDFFIMNPHAADERAVESAFCDASAEPCIMTTGLVGNSHPMEHARPIQQRHDEERRNGRRDSIRMDKDLVQPRQLTQATLRQTMQRYRKKSSMRKSANLPLKEEQQAINMERSSEISLAEGLRGIEEEPQKSENTQLDSQGLSTPLSVGNGQKSGSVAAALPSEQPIACVPAVGQRNDIKEELCKRLASQSSKVCKVGRWSWLKEKRDGNGNIPSHPDFDPRTLLIPENEFEALKGFNRQYWSIKKENMDLILFVRVGAFYELYDIDADVGLRVGLNPMGEKNGSLQANMWKVGFHARSFDVWCHKVLMLGYNVGRVEEVISVSQDCCESAGRNGLRHRRLEQVYTPGTFSLLAWTSEEHRVNNRPWMALCEGDNGLLACCLVDVVRGSFQLTEWQEVDSNRSVLEHLMLHNNLIEVVLPYWGHVSIDTKKLLKRFRPIVSDGIDRKLNVSLLRLGAMEKGTRIPITEEEAQRQILESVKKSGAISIHKFISEDNGIGYLSLLSLWTALTHLKSTSSGAGVLRVASVLPSLNTDNALVTGRLFMDTASIRSLDIVHGPLGTEKGSLFQFLSSKVVTKKGKHCLYDWLLNPLYREADIHERLDAIDSIRRQFVDAESFQKALLMLPDMEKTLPFIANRFAKMLQENSSIKDPNSDGFEQSVKCLKIGDFKPFCILIDSLFRFAEQAEAFFNSMHPKGSDSIESLSIFSRSYHHLCVLGQAISEMRGVFLMEGSDNDPLMIRRGLSLDVDAYSDALENLESILEKWKSEFFASMALIWRGSAQSLQKKILIKGSGANTVVQCAEDLGPLLEAQGFSCLMRTKKTLQFKVPKLIELAEAVEEGKRSLQHAVFLVAVKLMELYLALYNEFVLLSDSLGEMDALIGLALVTRTAGDDKRFTRPVLSRADPARGLFHEIKLSKVWNPQLSLPEVQGLTKNTSIQPNDVCLGGLEPNAMLLSGENSAGKSTLLRSVCVAVIMAQIGCYVPCERAELCPVDRIMTRMGARDRISAGESTFCVEMTEASAILKHATSESLVVIDELGRGTSPLDGEAIAAATLAFIASRCRTLFSTHYQNLNSYFASSRNIAMWHMCSGVEGKELCAPTFKLLPGPTKQGSGGIQCARRSGIPDTVLVRATEISQKNEAQRYMPPLETQVLVKVYSGLQQLTRAIASSQTEQTEQNSIRNQIREIQDLVRLSIFNEI